MRLVKAGLRPAFGLFVIAHGLTHAVLPLRGWMDPERLPNDFMPFILYATAVAGFTIAGLGVLGVRALSGAVRPLLVLASVHSFIAISRMGQGDLWWGIGVDALLFLTGLSGADRHLPAMPEVRMGLLRRTGAAAGIALLLYAMCAVVMWPFHRTWGSARAEHALALPGDAPDRRAALEVQHAVTVNAPPDAVWAWLVQLGQDRAGFYSYDWLERAFGVDVHNVSEIRPEWQQRAAGERVRATQHGYLGGVFGNDLGWTVKDVRPGRAMVLEYWGAFVLEPTEDGQTRFIIRTNVGHERMPAWAAALDMMAFQLPHFIMERRMMLRIKSLAEGDSRGV